MKKINNYIQYLLFRIVALILIFLPEKGRFYISETLGVLAYKLLKRRRITTLLNLKLVFPNKSKKELEEIAIKAYKNMGKAFVGTIWLDRYMAKEKNFHMNNKEGLLKLIEEGPFVLANMHFGNMEGIMKFTEFAEEYLFLTVGKDVKNPYINDYVIKNRKRFKIILLQKGASTSKEILKYAKAGKNIGLLTDHKDPGADVVFFGEKTTSPTGVTGVATKYKRPLILSYCIYREDNVTEAFYKEVEVCIDESLSFKERVQITTQNMINEMEKVILEYPEQWMWMHDRFRLYSRLKRGNLTKEIQDFANSINN